MRPPPPYQRFLAEMKRRRVFRVMAVYGAVAFGVVQVADLTFPRLGLPDWTVTLVLLLTLLGFPIAMVLAWAFDMTPEGLQRTEDASADELRDIAAAPATQRWPIGLAAAGGTALLLLGAWWVLDGEAGSSTVAASDADARVESIAVLPFADLSPEGDQAYFGDGLAEELLDALARVKGLTVAARTSSFRFRGDSVSIPDVADQLNVQTILEGSVRTGGNRLRITAQLVDANGFHLWSEKYDRSLDRMEDLIAVQEEIARAIVEALELAGETDAGQPLESLVVQGTDNLEAYNAVLRGRYLAGERTDRGLLGAIEDYERAVELDPAYARAWAELSMAHSLRLGWGFEMDQRDSVRALSDEAVERALELDPDLAEAHTALAYVAIWIDPDSAKAEQALARAIELDPNYATAWQWRGEHYSDTGYPESGIPYLERARQLDPLSPIIMTDLAEAYHRAGRYDAADSLLASVFELEPEFLPAMQALAAVHKRNGNAEAQLRTILRYEELRGTENGNPFSVRALNRAGRHAEVVEEFRAAVSSDTSLLHWRMLLAVDDFLVSLLETEGAAAVEAFVAAHRGQVEGQAPGPGFLRFVEPDFLRRRRMFMDGYAAAVRGNEASARTAIEALRSEESLWLAVRIAIVLGDLETVASVLEAIPDRWLSAEMRFDLEHSADFRRVSEDPRLQTFLARLPPYHTPSIVVDPTP